jgi:hypothetical protein
MSRKKHNNRLKTVQNEADLELINSIAGRTAREIIDLGAITAARLLRLTAEGRYRPGSTQWDAIKLMLAHNLGTPRQRMEIESMRRVEMIEVNLSGTIGSTGQESIQSGDQASTLHNHYCAPLFDQSPDGGKPTEEGPLQPGDRVQDQAGLVWRVVDSSDLQAVRLHGINSPVACSKPASQLAPVSIQIADSDIKTGGLAGGVGEGDGTLEIASTGD